MGSGTGAHEQVPSWDAGDREKLSLLCQGTNPQKIYIFVEREREKRKKKEKWKPYKKCVQDYRKPIQGKLEEQRPQSQALDDRGLQSQSSRHILAHFKKPPALAALPGDNKNPDGMAALLDSHRRVALLKCFSMTV